MLLLGGSVDFQGNGGKPLRGVADFISLVGMLGEDRSGTQAFSASANIFGVVGLCHFYLCGMLS